MLEDFDDAEIEDMLNIGFLYHDDGRQIDTSARENVRGKIVWTCYDYHQSNPVIRNETYFSLDWLLLCEHLGFDDIRREWRYQGVLLDAPKFCERLRHNKPCPCSLCVRRKTENQ